MDFLGGVLGGFAMISAIWPGALGEYIAKVVDSYETTRAKLHAKRGAQP